MRAQSKELPKYNRVNLGRNGAGEGEELAKVQLIQLSLRRCLPGNGLRGSAVVRRGYPVWQEDSVFEAQLSQRRDWRRGGGRVRMSNETWVCPNVHEIQ